MRNQYKILREKYDKQIINEMQITSSYVLKYMPVELQELSTDTTGHGIKYYTNQIRAFEDYINKQGAEWYVQQTGHKLIASGEAAIELMAQKLGSYKNALEEFYKQFQEWHD